MIGDPSQQLLHEILRGRVSRRTLAQRAAALGALGAAAGTFGTLLAPDVAAQDGTPAADVEPMGSLIWAINSDPVNLLPYGAVAGATQWAKDPIYDSLLVWDADLQVQPALATAYEVSDDATEYTFTLREGVLFHNGQVMTSADVKYSLEMAKTPPAPGVIAAWFANIETVKAPDDLTIVITMSKPDPTIVGALAWGRYSPIVPAGIYDQINVLSEAVGTGPFQLVEFVPNDRVSYTAFADHWNPAEPCVQDLELKVLPDEQSRVAAIRSGEVQGGLISADTVIVLENDDAIDIQSGLFAAPRVIHLNMVNDVPWRDVNVRRAINLAIDRQEIINNVYAGQAELTGPIPPGYGDYPLSADQLAAHFTNNVEQAQALMAEAGYADGFAVTLQAIAAPRDFTQIAEIIRERLRPLNIDVTVEPLEIGTFAENIGNGSFEWASTGRGMRGDPSGFVNDYRTGLNLNTVWFGEGWVDEEINGWYDEALAISDVAERQRLYHQIQDKILTDAVNIFTAQPYQFQAVDATVTGMWSAYTGAFPGLRVACVTPE